MGRASSREDRRRRGAAARTLGREEEEGATQSPKHQTEKEAGNVWLVTLTGPEPPANTALRDSSQRRTSRAPTAGTPISSSCSFYLFGAGDDYENDIVRSSHHILLVTP